MLVQFVDVARHAARFAFQIVLDRARKARMREPVRRKRLDRHQPAKQLVLALRSALEALEPVRDRELDRLVIAGLEMKQRHVLDRAPVPSVESAAGNEVERRGDGAPAALSQDHQRMLGQRIAQAQEEFPVQVRRRAVGRVGAPVAALEEFPVCAFDLRASQPAERHPGFAHAAPFLPDDLAPPVREAGEEIVEIGVTAVPPVELHGAAQKHSGAAHQRDFRRARKQHVQR